MAKNKFLDRFWHLWNKFRTSIFFHRFYLYWYLGIIGSYNCMQCQGKLMNQTWKNGTKTSSGSKVGPHNFLQGFYLCCILGQFYINTSNFFRTWNPYPSEFIHFCTICRYHWNMRTLKMSVPNFYWFLRYHYLKI